MKIARMSEPRINKEEIVISVKDLNFSYTFSDGRKVPVLKNVNVNVYKGERILLVGGNGTGKTTLLRILAGKHMTTPMEAVSVFNQPPFYQALGISGIEFLANNMWQREVAFVSSAVPYSADFAVHELMKDLQEEFQARRDEIVNVLDIDLNWRMNVVSDGQRRRVQIMLGLLRPFKLLLLDEVTTDLDALSRRSLMMYLGKETRERGATVVYCTHIFDGLSSFEPDRILYFNAGTIEKQEELSNGEASAVSIYDKVLTYLIDCRERNIKNNIDVREQPPMVEKFGSEGFGASRLQPSTRFASRQNGLR